MSGQAKRAKRPRDPNQLAAAIVAAATAEDGEAAEGEAKPADQEKNPAAVALGRLGGLKGGNARAKKLTSEQRSEIARLAAHARWKKSKP
jgi:hypothetical protein